MSLTDIIWKTDTSPYKYPTVIKDTYFKKKFILRNVYNNWVGQISKSHSNDIDWWASSIPERNTVNENLFHYLCILETLKDLKKKKIKLKKVVSSHKELIKFLKKNYKSTNIVFKIKKKNYINFYKIVIYNLLIFFLSKLKKINFQDLHHCSLLDTFIINKNLDSTRYYGALEKKIKKKKYYFSVIFYNIKLLRLLNLISKINKSKNYLLKEKFLSLRDVIFCFLHYQRVKKFKKKYKHILNYDFSDFIYYELIDTKNFQVRINAISYYLFFKRLNRNKIKIKNIINWFENTSIDKSINFASNKFLKSTITYGYQGFTCYKDFLCLDPTDYEYKFKILPQKIILIGKNYVNAKKEFSKHIKIIQGPALRFLYLKKYLKHKGKNILISLINSKEINDIILYNVSKSKYLKSKNVIIKTHPIMSEKDIDDYKLNNPQFNFTNLNFKKIIKRTSVVITGGPTSTIIESIANGIPVVIPFDNYFDKFSLKYTKIPFTMYKVTSSAHQLDRALIKLEKRNAIKKGKLLKLRQNLFNLSEKNIDNFVKIL